MDSISTAAKIKIHRTRDGRNYRAVITHARTQHIAAVYGRTLEALLTEVQDELEHIERIVAREVQ